jgi:ribonuclease HII
MLSYVYEKALFRKGYKLVAGVDEVGRGPLAGPIFAAAVILPLGCFIEGLNDSKKLSPQKRERLFHEIKEVAIDIGVASIGHSMIDRIGIGPANLLVMKRAVERLRIIPDFVLLDGKRYRIDIAVPQRAIISGDAKCPSIAAASIVAKVTRDRLMISYHRRFPLYGFAQHKGYGTRRHFQMLEKYGLCAIHRRSFL